MLLNLKSELDSVDAQGMTALHLSTLGGYAAVTTLLVDVGAHIGLKDGTGRTALMNASASGSIEAVEAVLEFSQTSDADADLWTALHYGAEAGSLAVVTKLLDALADVSLQESGGLTALHLAAGNGHKEVVELLCIRECDPRTADKDGWTPLFFAADNNRLETTEYLLDLMMQRGLDPLALTDKEGLTPLHHAAKNDTVPIIEVLVKNNLAIDAVDSKGTSPLMLACTHGNVAATSALTRLGAKADLKNTSDQTAEMLAINQGHIDCVSALQAK
jgi:ankyrin repeat protein